MPFTISYDFGDVVLVAFPFTSLQTTKKRPAIVISSTAYQQTKPDIVLIAVTSQIRPSLSIGEYILKDWQGAGLGKPSLIKPLIATLQQTQIISRLRKLALPDEAALRKLLADILR